MKKISNEFCHRQLTILIVLVIFKNIVSKLEKVGPMFSSFNVFNPFLSLPSVATDGSRPVEGGGAGGAQPPPQNVWKLKKNN